jgi:hypothetical protein
VGEMGGGAAGERGGGDAGERGGGTVRARGGGGCGLEWGEEEAGPARPDLGFYATPTAWPSA